MMKSFSIAIILATGLLVLGNAQAKNTNFKTNLNGNNEVPAVETETKGWSMFRFNKNFTLVNVTLSVRNGVGVLGSNGAHLHCAEKGENGPVITTLAGEIPGGVEGWLSIKSSMTDANINVTECGINLEELALAMAEGLVYVNVHSSDFPDGEIRGQVKQNRGKGKPAN